MSAQDQRVAAQLLHDTVWDLLIEHGLGTTPTRERAAATQAILDLIADRERDASNATASAIGSALGSRGPDYHAVWNEGARIAAAHIKDKP